MALNTYERGSQPTPAPSPVSNLRAGSPLEPASVERVSASEGAGKTQVATFKSAGEHLLREQLIYALADLQVRRVEVEAVLVTAAAEPFFRKTIAGTLTQVGPQTPEGRAILRAAQAEWRKERPDVNSASPEKIQDLIENVKSPKRRFAESEPSPQRP